MIVFFGSLFLLTLTFWGMTEILKRKVETPYRGLYLICFSWTYFSLVFYLAKIFKDQFK